MCTSTHRFSLCFLALMAIIAHYGALAFHNARGGTTPTNMMPRRRIGTTTTSTYGRSHNRSCQRWTALPSSTRRDAIREASFGCGCFWEPAESFLEIDGVQDTVAGYAGHAVSGSKPPSYESVCYGSNWVEAVRVRYDDERVSYQDLLEAMFEIQKPQLGSRQYASIIFPHDEEQRKIAQDWMNDNKDKQRSDGWRAEWTAVEPLSKFYKAEGYHQRYWQKQRPRFAVIGLLLAVSVGLLNSVIPETLQDTVESVANGSVVALGLFITLERFIDSKVVEI
jgi:methionine-S-sulfoxide reductase